MRLQLVRGLVGADLEAALALLDEIDRELREALDRVRTLANEIYPSLLEALGLADALRAAAAAAGVPARVEAGGVGRHPAEVEAAAYFTCRAALACLAADGRAGVAVTIRLTESPTTLELSVDQSGSGLETARARLDVEHDWIGALGGELTIEPEAGHATRLLLTLPSPLRRGRG